MSEHACARTLPFSRILVLASIFQCSHVRENKSSVNGPLDVMVKIISGANITEVSIYIANRKYRIE